MLALRTNQSNPSHILMSFQESSATGEKTNSKRKENQNKEKKQKVFLENRTKLKSQRHGEATARRQKTKFLEIKNIITDIKNN